MLSTYEMCRATGATYRMIDYWCRTGALRPARDARGSGSKRRFAPEQVPVVRALQRLAGLGAQHLVLEGVSRQLDERLAGEWNGLLFVDLDGRCHDGPPGDACWVLDLTALAERPALVSVA